MIKCRLKIISSNIINDIDTPQIKYISKNDTQNILTPKFEEKNEIEIYQNYENNPINTKNTNNNQLDQINSNNQSEHNESNEEQIYKNNINEIDHIEEFINKKIEDFIQLENNDSKIKENKNIENNELYTISNQHIYDENYYSPNVNNYNTISNSNKFESKNDSTNISESKKKHSKLKYIFRKRENKKYVNRSFSNNNKYSKENQNSKKYNLIKNIFKAHPVNYNITNMKILHGNKSANKVGNILNINISKSFCINNNIKINNKNILQNKLKSKMNNKSKESQERRERISQNKKEEKDVMKKVKNLNLKFNKKINKNKYQNSASWNVVENNGINYEQFIDYKMLIDELEKKECELIKEKENMIQTYEQKLKPIKELNNKLINENDDELDKKDELQGELVILKNQYEILLSKVNKENKNNKINADYNTNTQLNQEIKNIEQEMQELNTKLTKGEILLITKPFYIINISKKKEKNIILMLKGLFYSLHIRNTDEIVNLIWKKENQVQTIYFLINELMKIFKIKTSDKNILINFFYSFCKKYSYMDINTFKKEFKNKIGLIQLYNKNIYISRLMNFHRSKIVELFKLIREKDTFNLGIISFDKMNKLLNDLSLFKVSGNNMEEIYDFIMIIMKKNRLIKLTNNNNVIEIYEPKNEINYSLFDLFYESLFDLIKEHNSNIITNTFELIKNYMIKNDINEAESLLKPLLNDKYIIKINNKEYFDFFILNKYLKKLGIIKINEIISIKCFEEDLVDKEKFLMDIYNSGIKETNETNINKLKEDVNDFINEIFKNYH